jgi:hypothetical protein
MCSEKASSDFFVFTRFRTTRNITRMYIISGSYAFASASAASGGRISIPPSDPPHYSHIAAVLLLTGILQPPSEYAIQVCFRPFFNTQCFHYSSIDLTDIIRLAFANQRDRILETNQLRRSVWQNHGRTDQKALWHSGIVGSATRWFQGEHGKPVKGKREIPEGDDMCRWPIISINLEVLKDPPYSRA